MLRWTLSTLAGALFVTALAAQSTRDDDLLQRARQMNQIAAQKMEEDVRSALRDVQKLTSTDPRQAVEILNKTLQALDADTSLADDRRDQLKRSVRDRLRIAQLAAARAPAIDNYRGERQVLIQGRRADEERQEMDRFRLQQQLTEIRSMEKDGRREEASRLANELATRYPDNPAVEAMRRNMTVGALTSSSRQFQTERDRNSASTMREVANSSIPPRGEMDFPKDWKTRTKGRSATVSLTPREQNILKALGSPIDAVFKNTRIEDVVDYLITRTGQPIILDKVAMDEAGINYDTTVNINLKGVSLRTVLRKLFSEFNLNYVIKDESLFVTSAAKARDMMIVRTYYVADLATSLDPIWGNWAPAPFYPTLNQLQTAQNVQMLMEIIQSSVDPGSWAGKGNPGGGSIAYYPATMTLVIKQSAEVHAMLGGGGLLK